MNNKRKMKKKRKVEGKGKFFPLSEFECILFTCAEPL
jgi:hypothetical protein